MTMKGLPPLSLVAITQLAIWAAACDDNSLTGDGSFKGASGSPLGCVNAADGDPIRTSRRPACAAPIRLRRAKVPKPQSIRGATVAASTTLYERRGRSISSAVS